MDPYTINWRYIIRTQLEKFSFWSKNLFYLESE